MKMRIMRDICQLFIAEGDIEISFTIINYKSVICKFYKQSDISMKDKYQEKKQQRPICITYIEFELLLTTLPKQQAVELEQMVKSHTLIQHKRKQGYFTGSKSILQEIHYLIDKYTSIYDRTLEDITYLESDLSASQSIEQSLTHKQVLYCQSFNVNRYNYKQIMQNVTTATAVQSNRFQLCLSDGKRQTIKMDIDNLHKQIIITNRCNNNKRIYMVFEHIYEILELQALIDEEIPLFMFKQIMEYFQSQNNSNMSKSPICNDKEIFFFRRNKQQDWNKFINTINKKFGSEDHAILMKFRHLDELVSRKSFFLSHIRVVIDEDQLQINVEKIAQIKIHQNKFQSMHSLTELALKLLHINLKSFKFNNTVLDPISSFNAFLLQERKVNTMYHIQRKPGKRYVYFTFFKKMMEIEGEQQKQPVKLVQRTLTTEITDKFYLQALQKVRKHAAVNQLPFFMLYQDAGQIDKLFLQQLQVLQLGDINRLLGYRYLLNKIKFKWVTEKIFEQKQAKNRYEKHSFITFDRESPIFSKMSKLKSPSIIKKVKIKEKEREKGKMEVETQYAKLFIEKCIEQLGYK